MMALVGLAGVLLSGTALSAGCSQTCNDAYYFPGAAITLQEADDQPLTDGDYDVRVTVEGATLEFPFQKQADAVTCDNRDSCFSTEPLGPRFEASVTMDESALTVHVRNVESEDGPASITLQVSRDGKSVFDQEIVPEYSDDEPNGKGCGITTRASETFVLE